MSSLATSPTRPAIHHLPFPWHRMALYLSLATLILSF